MGEAHLILQDFGGKKTRKLFSFFCEKWVCGGREFLNLEKNMIG